MEYSVDNSIEVVTPVLVVGTTLGEVGLSFTNTRIRTFTDTPRANHLEFRDAEGNLKGFYPPEHLVDKLMELDFPWLSLPCLGLDRSSMKFYKEMGDDRKHRTA